MKNSFQLALNAVLVIAVAVLFYLHFANRPAAAPARKPAVAAANPTDTTAATTEVTPDTAALTAVADTDKVAFVESSRLFDGYKGMQNARKVFEVKVKRWEAQNQTLVSGFQTAVQQYQKQAESLSAEQRAATEQKLQAQQQQVGLGQQKLQQEAQEEEAKMMETELSRLNKQIEKYGKANGYRLILTKAPTGVIAYGRKDLDITPQVLKYLNAGYGVKK